MALALNFKPFAIAASAAILAIAGVAATAAPADAQVPLAVPLGRRRRSQSHGRA